jgi:hypothetical protein
MVETQSTANHSLRPNSLLNREITGNRPLFRSFLWPMTSGKATEMLGFFTKFSEEWNRELFFVIREGGAVPSKPIDEPSLLFPFHRTSVTYRFTSGRNTGKSQPSTG